ncbi:MAG TPA: hypothetical protein VHG93_28365 [Longimicrobium sp.]|nr:hypothetical protein [Longimicrobium sp.]
MKRSIAVLAIPLLSLAACGDGQPVLCPVSMDLRVAAPVSLEVTVVDSLTGQSLVPGARGRWIVGTYTDSLFTAGSTLVGYGLTGRNTVLIEAPGYWPWARSDIQVRRDECDIETVAVTARMQRQ